MQVGIWGDTSEIVYCSGFGYHDYLPPTEPSSEEQNQPNALTPLTLGIIASLVAIPIISISVIALKRKNENDKQS